MTDISYLVSKTWILSVGSDAVEKFDDVSTSKAFQKFFPMIFIMSKKNYDFCSIIKFMSSSHLPQQGVHSNSASISRHLVTPASITAVTSRSLIPLQLQTNIIELAIFQY